MPCATAIRPGLCSQSHCSLACVNVNVPVRYPCNVQASRRAQRSSCNWHSRRPCHDERSWSSLHEVVLANDDGHKGLMPVIVTVLPPRQGACAFVRHAAMPGGTLYSKAQRSQFKGREVGLF